LDWQTYKDYWAGRGYAPLETIEELTKDLIAKQGLAYLREHTEPGHWTASGFIWDPKAKKMLMMHHRKLDKWLQPGGHADGDTDLAAVAAKETWEETGIAVNSPVTWGNGLAVFDFDIHEIPARKTEPQHLHFDVRYLFLADSTKDPVQNSESNAVRWLSIEEVYELTNEESILRPIRKIKSGGCN